MCILPSPIKIPSIKTTITTTALTTRLVHEVFGRTTRWTPRLSFDFIKINYINKADKLLKPYSPK